LGGIDGTESALAYFQAGASLIEIYTGLVFEGPGLVAKINRELGDYLDNNGLKNIDQIVGQDA